MNIIKNLHHHNKSRSPTLAAAISHLISITTTITITTANHLQVSHTCNHVSHTATIVRHIINKAHILMSSPMISSCDPIAMCE
jgi:hypothetical protein